jgi:hypothetical protein
MTAIIFSSGIPSAGPLSRLFLFVAGVCIFARWKDNTSSELSTGDPNEKSA